MYKVISFDIFQTLVDVNKRISQIWQDALKEDYTYQKAVAGANAIIEFFPDEYAKAVSSEKFTTMDELYTKVSEKVLGKLYFDCTPQQVAYSLMFQHSKAPFYDDVFDCFKRLRQKYKIVLSSDSNHLMVDELIRSIGCSDVFISDDLECYKGDRQGRFFKAVLSRLNVAPDEILHIGDSHADIYGAHKAGIDCCWLNRDGRIWHSDVTPTFEINNLKSLVLS